VIKPTDSRNRAFYKREISPLQIIIRREVEPGPAKLLIDEITRVTGR
jgi:hypothetical protein